MVAQMRPFRRDQTKVLKPHISEVKIETKFNSNGGTYEANQGGTQIRGVSMDSNGGTDEAIPERSDKSRKTSYKRGHNRDQVQL